jgi:hypothetical protein
MRAELYSDDRGSGSGYEYTARNKGLPSSYLTSELKLVLLSLWIQFL